MGRQEDNAARQNGSRLVSVSEFARIMGVSRQAVYRWARAGHISWKPGGGKIDVERARAEVAARVDPSMGKAVPRPLAVLEAGARADGGDALPADALAQAKVRKMRADAALAELKLRKQRGELVEAEAVAELVEAAFVALRKRILAVPGRLRASLAALEDEFEVEALLEADLRSALEAGAASIRALSLGADPKADDPEGGSGG